MNYLDEYDHYIEELFQAQFDISDQIITHQLEKGLTREDFIKDDIIKRFHNINVKKGFISGSDRCTSNQTDLLILKNSAQTRMLGGNCLAEVEDVSLVIEIKSNAKGNDLKKFNEDILLIQQQNTNKQMPLFGMFCYRIALKTKTIFNRFGFDYDPENDLYQFADPDISRLSFEYPQIDFLISIDKSDGKRFIFFRKTADENNNSYYVSLTEPPITKHLWNTIKGTI